MKESLVKSPVGIKLLLEKKDLQQFRKLQHAKFCGTVKISLK